MDLCVVYIPVRMCVCPPLLPHLILVLASTLPLKSLLWFTGWLLHISTHLYYFVGLMYQAQLVPRNVA